MKIKHITLLIITCVITSSCAPKIKNFSKYQKQFLSKSQFMPSKKDLAGKQPKVVVFALEENDNKTATQAALGKSLANNIENILSKNRLAELVNRRANKKLQEEIALAEMNKTGSYKGPRVADYAISGAIANAGFTSKYSSGSTFFNPKSGQLVSIPPKYKYSSDVSGNIKIYELPSLKTVEAIEFKGKKSRSENVRQNGGVHIGSLQIGGKKLDGTKRDDSLVRRAGKDAIANIKTELQNAFAKKGYILEKRTYKNKTIFKISLGSKDGMKMGNKFEISGQYETQNPITEEEEIERRIITSGVISDKIDPKASWVLIDDKDQINSIRLGDTVKIKYKRNAFAKMAKSIKSLIP